MRSAETIAHCLAVCSAEIHSAMLVLPRSVVGHRVYLLRLGRWDRWTAVLVSHGHCGEVSRSQNYASNGEMLGTTCCALFLWLVCGVRSVHCSQETRKWDAARREEDAKARKVVSLIHPMKARYVEACPMRNSWKSALMSRGYTKSRNGIPKTLHRHTTWRRLPSCQSPRPR